MKVLFLKKKYLIILILLIIIFSHQNKFFINSFKILTVPLDERIKLSYGFCELNGYGFTKTALEFVPRNKSIIVLNDVDTSGINWIYKRKNLSYLINEDKKITNFDYIIYLNFKNKNKAIHSIKEDFMNIYNETYKVVYKKQNCYLLEKKKYD